MLDEAESGVKLRTLSARITIMEFLENFPAKLPRDEGLVESKNGALDDYQLVLLSEECCYLRITNLALFFQPALWKRETVALREFDERRFCCVEKEKIASLRRRE